MFSGLIVILYHLFHLHIASILSYPIDIGSVQHYYRPCSGIVYQTPHVMNRSIQRSLCGNVCILDLVTL